MFRQLLWEMLLIVKPKMSCKTVSASGLETVSVQPKIQTFPWPTIVHQSAVFGLMLLEKTVRNQGEGVRCMITIQGWHIIYIFRVTMGRSNMTVLPYRMRIPVEHKCITFCSSCPSINPKVYLEISFQTLRLADSAF